MTAAPASVVIVDQVEQLAAAGGIAAHLDAPKPGQRSGGTVLTLVGWALGCGPTPAVAVEIRAGDTVLQRVPLGSHRPDLRDAFPREPRAGTAGFRAKLPLVGLDWFEIFVDSILADSSRAPVARIVARRTVEEQSTPGPATLVTVVVTALRATDGLDAAVESVIAQTYPNFEVIVACRNGDSAVGELARKVGAVPVSSAAPTYAA
ncbi:MAG: glycosyltransferase, partial [Actinomycetota bacterium]|nr:glycosyltransferase [Actinomycetota bacterium]